MGSHTIHIILVHPYHNTYFFSTHTHSTKHQLYGHLPPITKTTQIRQTRNAGHCWRSRDELISDELLWTLSHGRAKVGLPARTYIQQLCEGTGCSPGDLPDAMNNQKIIYIYSIHIYIYIYIYIYIVFTYIYI